ncbi:uncharacterized protein METZ01_LOCUS429644, partial [marine metagenome]
VLPSAPAWSGVTCAHRSNHGGGAGGTREIQNDENLKGAIVTDGGGRGFIVESPEALYVVTASHFLPRFPP